MTGIVKIFSEIMLVIVLLGVKDDYAKMSRDETCEALSLRIRIRSIQGEICGKNKDDYLISLFI